MNTALFVMFAVATKPPEYEHAQRSHSDATQERDRIEDKARSEAWFATAVQMSQPEPRQLKPSQL